jgi:hypothetical protein
MPEKPDAGIDYLTGDIGNNVAKLPAEAHWYDSLDLPFDLMTEIKTVDGAEGPGQQRPRLRPIPKPRPQMEQEMAIIIANGGRYFAWDNPTPESGLMPERQEFLGRVVAPFLRARQRWCLGSKRLPDASLLHSAASHYAATAHLTSCFPRTNNDRINGATAALAGLHLNYEIIPDWRLHEQDIRSPLLIVEHPAALEDRTADDLIQYVQAGGTLLMTGMGATLNKRLRDVLGIADCVGPGQPEQLVMRIGDATSSFKHFLYRVNLSAATPIMDVKNTQGKKHPIMTRNRFGRGLGFYVAIPLLSRHKGCTVPPDLLQFVFDRTLPSNKRRITTNAPDTVEVVLRQKDDAQILHLVNMAPGQGEATKAGRRALVTISTIPPVPACHVSVRLPAKPAAVKLQPQNVALANWSFANGRLEADIPGFAIHQMVVMH